MSDYRIELQQPDYDCPSWRWRVTLLGNTVGHGMGDDESVAQALAESWLAAYRVDPTHEGLAW